MLRVIVLGAAAGGGIPQWNCGCPVCSAARSGHGNGHDKLGRDKSPVPHGTQTSIAVTVDDEHWFLINASPDLRQQLIATPQLFPRPGQLRHSPVAGVILTNGEVDAVAGLLSMREGSPFQLYAHDRVLAILRENSIFNVLNDKMVARIPIAIDVPFEPRRSDGSPSGLEVLAFNVSGKGAWYLEGKVHPGGEDGRGDTVGLRISDKHSGKYFYFIAACAGIDSELKRRIFGAPLVFFDGTLWRDDEMIALGLGIKTGQRMGHIAMSGEDGAIAGLADLGIGRKIFLHINNSNPALLHGSKERDTVIRAGWDIAWDGMEVVL